MSLKGLFKAFQSRAFNGFRLLMDGHSVLAALRSNLSQAASSSPQRLNQPADDCCQPILSAWDSHISESRVPLASASVSRIRKKAASSQTVKPNTSTSVCVGSKPAKRAYRPNRPSRLGLTHKPHKQHTGKKDGLSAVRKRAGTLKRRIGLRTDKLSEGGGLPNPRRRRSRRQATFNALEPDFDGVSLKPLSSQDVPDIAWKDGVNRLTHGATTERFDLLRRLTLGNAAFVAAMPGASAGAAPVVREEWWRATVSRGWQFRLTDSDIVIAGGRAKWRGGGAGGGGRYVVSTTRLVNQGDGFVLGNEFTVSEDMVVDAGVFVDWSAAKTLFIARDAPLVFSKTDASMPSLPAQLLPPLPQDSDSAAGAERLDAIVVLPQAALAACAADGHSPKKHGLGNVCWVMDEPQPRAFRKAFYVCLDCGKSPLGEDGLHMRRFRKVPTLADINAYFPKVDGMGTVFLEGQTFYTIWFLLSLASHFCLRPQVTELTTWLAERWGLAALGIALHAEWYALDWPHQQLGQDTAGIELPWIFDALRGSEVLVGLVERFVGFFLDGLCEQVESEAWLADSAVFGADVCVKLAKVVVRRVKRQGRVQRLYTGVLLHIGARGMLLSIPLLVRRETNEAYKVSLKPKLARLRRQASELGFPNSGLPVGAFVDTLGFEAGLKEAVCEEFHGVIDSSDSSRALADDFQVGKDGNHLNWHFEKYAPKQSFDYELGSDCHRDMIARHNNPDRPDDAQRDALRRPWKHLLPLVPVLLALMTRWAGAARRYFQECVVGRDTEGKLKNFVQTCDVIIHPLWGRVFPEVAANRTIRRRGSVQVPRVFVERLAHLLGVVLHKASLAWGYATDEEWSEEVDCFGAYFATSIYTIGSPNWMQEARDATRESEEVVPKKSSRQMPLATPVIEKHLANLLSARIRHGLRVGRELALLCAQAGVAKASGTTDLDALCHELEILLLRRGVTTLDPNLARMIFKTLFLRVHTRRMLKGALPTIARGQTTLGVLILQIQQFLALSQSPEHMALTVRAWTGAQADLARDGGRGK